MYSTLQNTHRGFCQTFHSYFGTSQRFFEVQNHEIQTPPIGLRLVLFSVTWICGCADAQVATCNGVVVPGVFPFFGQDDQSARGGTWASIQRVPISTFPAQPQQPLSLSFQGTPKTLVSHFGFPSKPNKKGYGASKKDEPPMFCHPKKRTTSRPFLLTHPSAGPRLGDLRTIGVLLR